MTREDQLSSLKRGSSTQTDSSLRPTSAPIIVKNEEEDSLLDLFDLDNDALSLMLEYTDYESHKRFTRGLSKAWSHRCVQLLGESRLERRIYARHGFSPENTLPTITALDLEIRRQLDQTLCPLQKSQIRKQQRWTNPFLLRHVCFGFVPVLPDDWNVGEESNSLDPPPVSFDCDSFWLTSSGTSGEMIFLNPFSTSLSVWENVWSHTTAVDTEEKEVPPPLLSLTFPQNPPSQRQRKQVLLDTSSYFDMDLADYFPRMINHDRNNDNLEDEQEFELAYIGVEAKPVLHQSENGDLCVDGTMAAVGRIVSRDDNDLFIPHAFARHGENMEDWHSVTEILTWFRSNINSKDGKQSSNHYDNQHVCRFRGGFRTMDVCANQRCVYVNPWSNEGEWNLDRDMEQPVTGQEQVVVYPMMELESENHDQDERVDQKKGLEYFPAPLAVLSCREAVTALQASPTGDVVLVATIHGNIQLWNMRNPKEPELTDTVSCFKGLVNAFGRSGRFLTEIDKTTDAAASIPGSHPSAVEDIYVSRHLPIHQAGFMTLQHSPGHGSSLLLWKHAGDAWRVEARINLPLSSSRFPKVHFDGRKIIVFGQDHIGFLILVYQVFYSNEDVEFFALDKVKPGVATSGGVVTFDASPQVRFAKRIRHAALGGLETFDPLHMTCNERFIVVSTKLGHFAESQEFMHGEGDETMFSLNEGLLVIDLQREGLAS